MKSEPWVKFGMRISPKMREKPADSRNSNPPKVMLLTASTSQKFMVAVVPRSACKRIAGAAAAPALRHLSRLERREVARVDWLFEKFLLVVSPELTHVRVGLDRLVD